MGKITSNVKQFRTLTDAIDFISKCVESNSPLALFNETILVERQAEKYVEDPEHFVKYTFPELQRQFQVIDFRVRYKGRTFPENVETLKLGGHDKELGHMHIDFLKRGDNWVIEKIWQCR